MAEVSFEAWLEGLTQGDLAESSSAGTLSDLDSEKSTQLDSVWVRIPDETRLTLVSEAGILAEDDVAYDFEQLMLIALEDPDPHIRRLAAAGLSESTSRKAVEKIRKHLLGDDDPTVRAAAAGALVPVVTAWDGQQRFRVRHREVLDALHSAATEDASEEVQAQAMVAAASSPESWLSPVIEDAYYGDDRELRLASVQAMGMTADEDWLEFLIEQLSSEDSDFRTEAATACGEMGSEDAIEPLATLAGDESEEVVLAAIAAITRIGGGLALEFLIDLKADPPPGTDMEVLDAAIAEVRDSATDPTSMEPDD